MTTEQLERLKQIRERHRLAVFAYKGDKPPVAVSDIGLLLSLLDSQGAGGDMRVLGEIRQRIADGYESASSRNVITVAALTLKDLHYVLSSHDGQYARGATAMRDRCVEKVQQVVFAEMVRLGINAERAIQVSTKAATSLEAVTLEQQQEKQSNG